ncbi:unnamed protein product, partial [Ectocarpus sp. 12 AP-2014]
MSGIPIEDERLQKVTEWVSKQEDPIHGELLPDASQLCVRSGGRPVLKLGLEQWSPSTARLPLSLSLSPRFRTRGGETARIEWVGGKREELPKWAANLACTAITRWMPRDDWWMCFGLPSNSKDKFQDLGAAHSWIQRCSRTGANNTPFDRLHVSTAAVGPLVTLRCSWL